MIMRKEYLRFIAIVYALFFTLTGIFILIDGILLNPGNNKLMYFVICFALAFHGVIVAVIILALHEVLKRQEIISDNLIDNIHDKSVQKFEGFHLFKN
jgi:uncharacterized membrane protein YhaH (DUF805 family)